MYDFGGLMSFDFTIGQFSEAMSQVWQQVTKLTPEASQKNIEGVIKILSIIRPPMSSAEVEFLSGRIKTIVKQIDQTKLNKGDLAEIQFQFFETCFPVPTNFSILGELSNAMQTFNYPNKLSILQKIFSPPGRFNLLVKACEECVARGNINEIDKILKDIIPTYGKTVLTDPERRHFLDAFGPKKMMACALILLSKNLKGDFLHGSKPLPILDIMRSIQEADHELEKDSANLKRLFEVSRDIYEGKGMYHPPQKRIGEIWEKIKTIQIEIRNSYDFSNDSILTPEEKEERDIKINTQINKEIEGAFPSLKEELSKLARLQIPFDKLMSLKGSANNVELIEFICKKELESAYEQLRVFSRNKDFAGAKEVLSKLSSSDKKMLLQLAFDKFERMESYRLSILLFILENINEVDPLLLSRINDLFIRVFSGKITTNFLEYTYPNIIGTLILTKNFQDFYQDIRSSVQRLFASSDIKYKPVIAPLLILLGIVDSPEDVIKLIREGSKDDGLDQMVNLFNKHANKMSNPVEKMRMVQVCRKNALEELQKETKSESDGLPPKRGFSEGSLSPAEVAQRTLLNMKKFKDRSDRMDYSESAGTMREFDDYTPHDIDRQYKQESTDAYLQIETSFRNNDVQGAMKVINSLSRKDKQLFLELAFDRYGEEKDTFPILLFALKNVGAIDPFIKARLENDFKHKDWSRINIREYAQIIETLMLAPNIFDFFEDIKKSVMRRFIDTPDGGAPELTQLLILLNIAKEPWEVLKIIKDNRGDDIAARIIDEYNKNGVVERMKQAVECRKNAEAELRATLNELRPVHDASTDVVGIFAEYASDDALLAQLGLRHLNKITSSDSH